MNLWNFIGIFYKPENLFLPYIWNILNPISFPLLFTFKFKSISKNLTKLKFQFYKIIPMMLFSIHGTMSLIKCNKTLEVLSEEKRKESKNPNIWILMLWKWMMIYQMKWLLLASQKFLFGKSVQRIFHCDFPISRFLQLWER